MLKTLLLATTMVVAVPALAQTTGTTGGTTTGGTGSMQTGQTTGGTMSTPTDTTTTTAPTDSTMSTGSSTSTRSTGKSSRSRRGSTSSTTPQTGTATDPMNSAPLGTQSTTPDPSQPQPQTADASGATAATPAATAMAQPATGATGVGSVVDQEFAAYDKDADGQLSKTEFSAWMDALKAKQPGNASAMADPAYNAKAFAQADTDKSAALSKGELTTFLSGGKAAS